jgi:hypothetical protein
MAVSQETIPTATEPLTGVECFWNAGFNYNRFTFQRQDRVFATVTDVSGFARFNFSTSPPSGVDVDTPIYVQSADGTTYNVRGLVTAVSGNNITTDIPYVGSTSGFGIYPTVIKDWRVEVIIDIWNGSAYVPINGQSPSSTTPIAKFQNLPNGDIIAELQNYLQSELIPDYTYDSINLNWLNNNYTRYQVRYRENYYGLTAGAYLVVQDGTVDADFWAVNAAMQLKATLAPNLANYLVIDDVDCDALFLSGFTRPTYWSGYPFDLSFLWNLGDTGITAIQIWYDENLNVVDSTALGTLSDKNGKMGRIGVDRGVVTSNAFTYTAIRITESSFPFLGISETKIIKVGEVCDNAIMLTWLNKLGGWDYWLFTNRNTTSYGVSNSGVFEPYIEDMATANSTEVVLLKQGKEAVTLAANNLDSNDVTGLKGLLSSTAVYAIDEDGNVLYRTTVNGGTWNVADTKKNTFDLTITILKPSEFKQNN